jgi:hypothetical protein
MNALLCFTKIAAGQNILFDEFFMEATKIEFIAFNYDGAGAAICRCDATLQQIDQDSVNKILFGVTKERLGAFIKGIFDPDTPTDDLQRIGGSPHFRIAELNELSKYSLGNLAKKIHKELQKEETEQFHYYTELQATANPGPTPRPGLLHGNTNKRRLSPAISPANCAVRIGERFSRLCRSRLARLNFSSVKDNE